tara:strand:- start:2399 stop:4534 length:2136 start_codon:yes stop_codon:yes gene_type:complete
MTIREWNNIRKSSIRSQKAIGILDLQTAGNITPTSMVSTIEELPHALSTWRKKSGYNDREVFVRTCPVTPRHGVIDSTKIDMHNFLNEAWKMQRIMREHEPDGCFVIQQLLDAHASAVLSPSQRYIIIGRGTDGITAGHGETITLDLHSTFVKDLMYRLGNTNAVYDNDNYEIELVSTRFTKDVPVIDVPILHHTNDFDGASKTFFTQVRKAGEHIQIEPPPKGVDINGFITDGVVVVNNLYTANGLENMQWLEENITPEKCPEGFVVAEPNGSLLSHIAAHCRGAKVPYIVGNVEVGERWVEPANGWVVKDQDGNFKPNPYNPADYFTEFMEGVDFGNKFYCKQFSWLATYFHQFQARPLQNPKEVAFFAGIFAAWIVKATFSISVGEMRHANRRKNSATITHSVFLHHVIGKDNLFVMGSDSSDNGVTESRKHYYLPAEIGTFDWSQVADILDFCRISFRVGWESSYGGTKYAETCDLGKECAVWLNILEKVLIDNDDQQYHKLSPLLVAINKLENAQHNTGHFFNKFTNKRSFDMGTTGVEHIDDAFMLYEIVRYIRHKKEIEHNTKVEHHDLTNAVRIIEAKPTWLRNNLYKNKTEEPETDSLRDLFYGLNIVDHRRHPKGKYGSIYSSDFIQCGESDCHTCKEHEMYWSEENWAKDIPSPQPEKKEDYDVYLVEKDLSRIKKLENAVWKALAEQFGSNKLDGDMNV